MLTKLTDVVVANKSYTKYNVPAEEKVDEIVLRVIRQDCPDFLLPISIMEVDDEKEIRYELFEGTRLSFDYDSAKKNMRMRKKDFILLLKNMLLPFKTCGDWFLDYHNILLDPAYILIGRKGYSVKYLYLPIRGYVNTETEVVAFFDRLIKQMEVEDDAHYPLELLRVLSGDNANPMTLLEYILKEDVGTNEGESGGKAVYRAELPQAAESARRAENFRERVGGSQAEEKRERAVEKKADTRFEGAGARPGAAGGAVGAGPGAVGRESARPGVTVKEFGKQDIQGQLQAKLFGDDEEDSRQEKQSKSDKGKTNKGKKENSAKEKSGLFGFLGKNKDTKAEVPVKNQDRPVEQARIERTPEPWQYAEGEDETEVGGAEIDISGILRLELIESKGKGDSCPRMVELDLREGAITVGRLDANGQAHSDYSFDSTVIFISKRQFRVEWIDGQYTIIDLGSRNGTFVNGQVLAPNIRQYLQEGDCIRLSGPSGMINYRVC